jgi:DNA-directed RNA polymerase subunit RPC12/RpoP
MKAILISQKTESAKHNRENEMNIYLIVAFSMITGSVITLTGLSLGQKYRDSQCAKGNHKPMALEDGCKCRNCGVKII